jgi:DNA-binding winged helix-turn-helix (wHTH) protein
MAEVPSVANGGPQTGLTNASVRFGNFEVDLRAGELRKSGLKIKLQGQPLAVLALLLERPGQVVTREELQQKLWAGEAFVDFEHGLNKAIGKVRDALADNANNPRFIETLPRRGYRFIAPVDAAGLVPPPRRGSTVPRISCRSTTATVVPSGIPGAIARDGGGPGVALGARAVRKAGGRAIAVGRSRRTSHRSPRPRGVAVHFT